MFNFKPFPVIRTAKHINPLFILENGLFPNSNLNYKKKIIYLILILLIFFRIAILTVLYPFCYIRLLIQGRIYTEHREFCHEFSIEFCNTIDFLEPFIGRVPERSKTIRMNMIIKIP